MFYGRSSEIKKLKNLLALAIVLVFTLVTGCGGGNDSIHMLERRELNSAEARSLATVLSGIGALCRDAGCTEEETERHVELAREVWLNIIVDQNTGDTDRARTEARGAIEIVHFLQ